ncbi:CHC2 zinc finger domain-containing protein [Rugamonas sp.]|uniref:CHC2 zinc finger domain-containing protein n=1 Tax=Rugamonas sp. TaxID=1926287 RepID=UPI0025DD89D6|nr:CHC2 zinc finger domain-containing protein [Rugamonas sp.]
MSIQNLLLNLQQVKKRGRDKWQACCPAHDDIHPSLAIRELDDGRILLHCFAGCGAAEVLGAIDMNFSDLYPKPIGGNFLQGTRRQFSASDVLVGIAFETLVAWHFAKQLASNHELSDLERERLLTCARRLQNGMEAALG